MNNRYRALMVLLCCVAFGASAVAGQHRWRPSSAAGRADELRPVVAQPHAVLGPANGLYCPDMTEGAVGVHDLGWMPSGLNVEVNVESYSESAFDPVAAVVVASLGLPGGNNVKTTTFYDNDSGGGKDAKITFVAPQNGTYMLLVTDYPGTTGGCYRYQASIGR